MQKSDSNSSAGIRGLRPIFSLVEVYESFLKRYYWDQIISLSNAYPERRSLDVNFNELDIFNPDLADKLLDDPDESLEAATQALREIDLPTGVNLTRVHFRIGNLPRKIRIRKIRSDVIGQLICIEGVVRKATDVRPRIQEAAFECPFCHHIFSTPQAGSQFKEPYECPQEDGGCGRKVQRFLLRVDQSVFEDGQTIQIQELHEGLRGGELPESLDIYLQDDLAGLVVPGDKVSIIGILRSFQRVTQYGKKLYFDLYLDAISLEKREEAFEDIEITDEDEARIRELSQQQDIFEQIQQSIAPSIFGNNEIKAAITLQLFSGVPKRTLDDMHIRGDAHVLLVGDPGTAKSQLLRLAVGIAPRGMYGSGKSSTGAGLTAAAVKDPDFGRGDGKWTLEAGTVVLADRGLAALDEMDKMPDQARDHLHEAMEQQTVTISKAGLYSQMQARCAVLGAANPKHQRFDLYRSISEQIKMPPALLSRFDLIFIVVDKPEKQRDGATSAFILQSHRVAEIRALERAGRRVPKAAQTFMETARDVLEPKIGRELLQKYIAFARRNSIPIMSDEATAMYHDFYLELRSRSYDDEDIPIPVTSRLLEALIRLGEAKARVRLASEVTAEDAAAVIELYRYCLKTVFTDPETGHLDSDWVFGEESQTQAKTAREVSAALRSIVQALETEYGEEVPLAAVWDRAEDDGISRDKAEEIIETMKRDGILYSPGGGVVKFV